jgi:hypothetical protein
MPKDNASEPCSSFVARLGTHLECSLEHCPIIVCKFLGAVEGELLIITSIWKGKVNPRKSCGANDYQPLTSAERYPVAIVWHLVVVARGTLTALANITEMLANVVAYGKNIMAEKRMSWNAKEQK